MKNRSCSLCLLLFFGSLSTATIAQALPENPAPPPPNPAWTNLQNLAHGQAIVVDNTNGPPVHCLFTGVTEAYLFCSPPGNPAGVGFRFDRADVLGVDLDLPPQQQAQANRPERNYHPVWLSCIVAGGILTGLTATHNTDAGHATEAGLIGAVVVAAIGAPMAFLPHPQYATGGPVYPQFGIGIPLRHFAHPHPHRLFCMRISR